MEFHKSMSKFLRHASVVYFFGVVFFVLCAVALTLTQGAWGSSGTVQESGANAYCVSVWGNCATTQEGAVHSLLVLLIGTFWALALAPLLGHLQLRLAHLDIPGVPHH